jgi:hypothetical protein
MFRLFSWESNCSEHGDKTNVCKYFNTPQTCMAPGSWPTQTMEFAFGWRKDTVAYSGSKIRAIGTPSLYRETRMELIPLYLVSTVACMSYRISLRVHHNFSMQFYRRKVPYYWVQWLRLALSEGPNRVGVSRLSPEDGNRFSFWNTVFYSV